MEQAEPFYSLLQGGARNGVGERDKAVVLVQDNPALFPALFQAMLCDRAEVAMRAASAFDLASEDRAHHIQALKTDILDALARALQADVRWHLYHVLARLDLTPDERSTVLDALDQAIAHDPSKIVIVNALQALFELAQRFPDLKPQVREALEQGLDHEAGSVRARSKKLLKLLGA